ncbi:MAG: hypothetical protein AAF648_14480 [Pseudomonadota bacterium]
MSSNLDKLIDLLRDETEQLQANLELLRRTSRPGVRDLQRRLVERIDERHDRLEELERLRRQLLDESVTEGIA